jgi:glycosyltransferase involved in cell wall biosynthesis
MSQSAALPAEAQNNEKTWSALRERTAQAPVRIAVVVSHPIQHFAPLHRELAALPGVELKVFFCANWGSQTYFDRDFATEFKWDIPLLDGYSFEFLPGKSKTKLFGLLSADNPSITSALDAFQPDIVQVFGYAHRTMWRAVAWSRRNKRPALLYSDSNASAQRGLVRRIAKAVIVGFFYRRVDGALFVGDNNYQYHRRYGISGDRLFPCALPIDRDRLIRSAGDAPGARREIRARHRIPEDAFVAVFSGKLTARKSPVDLLRAIHRCNSRGAEIWALFAGEGTERRAMEEMIRELKIQTAVLAGFVNQSSIGKYYAASDVLVVPSAYDPHPLVLPEAGCFGLPVVVSDRLGCIGQSDTARDGSNALIYPYGDTEELAKCLSRLRSERDLYSSMSQAALQIAESQDVSVTAQALKSAALELRRMGVRRKS